MAFHTIIKKKPEEPLIKSPKILLTVKEACELTGVSQYTMRAAMHDNDFMVRIGRRTLIHKKKFEKWIDSQS